MWVKNAKRGWLWDPNISLQKSDLAGDFLEMPSCLWHGSLVVGSLGFSSMRTKHFQGKEKSRQMIFVDVLSIFFGVWLKAIICVVRKVISVLQKLSIWNWTLVLPRMIVEKKSKLLVPLTNNDNSPAFTYEEAQGNNPKDWLLHHATIIGLGTPLVTGHTLSWITPFSEKHSS